MTKLVVALCNFANAPNKMALFVSEPFVGLLWWEAALEYSALIFDWPTVTNQGKKKPRFSSFHQNHIPCLPSPATPIFIVTPPLQFILHSGTLSLCSVPRGKFSPSRVLFLVAENSSWLFVSVDVPPLTNNSDNPSAVLELLFMYYLQI